MDTLLTFESSYESYTSSYTPNDWTPSDLRKIWHIIYNASASAVSSVVALAKQRSAGLVEVTNAYWTTHTMPSQRTHTCNHL
jgi:hypothetical protein